MTVKDLTYLSRGLMLIGSFCYLLIPEKNYMVFMALLVACAFVPEIIGILFGKKNVKGKRAIKQSRKTKSTEESKQLKTKLTDNELMQADVDTLSGTNFERLIALYYLDQGYDVQMVGGSGDNEVDLILRGKEGYKIAVQCKRWKKNVGNDIVLRLKAGKQFHGCLDARIITTSYFTRDAVSAAEKLNITLINGITIMSKLDAWKKKKGIKL
jgi:restriction system protein